MQYVSHGTVLGLLDRLQQAEEALKEAMEQYDALIDRTEGKENSMNDKTTEEVWEYLFHRAEQGNYGQATAFLYWLRDKGKEVLGEEIYRNLLLAIYEDGGFVEIMS